MKKLYSIILTAALLFTLIIPVGAADENPELIASENVTLQSIASAYTANANLRTKNQQGATERVSFIKFDYSQYEIDKMAVIELNLFVKLVSGTGQEELNKARLYWSADTAWSAEDNAIKFDAVSAYNNKAEIGDNLIQIPQITSASNHQKYYCYDVTEAVKANAAAGNTAITFILKQDRMMNASGGLDFAANSETGHEPKLTFFKAAEGNRLVAAENVTLQSDGTAYTASQNLRVKNSQGANIRVSFIKFNYAGYSVNDADVIALNLHTREQAGTGREEINNVRLYWSADTTWSEETNAIKYIAVGAYNNKTEIGDNIIQIPYMSSSNEKYYSYDVTAAVKANAAAGNKAITFILEQDQITDGNGGIEFASRNQTGCEPNLTFKNRAFSADEPAFTRNGEPTDIFSAGDVLTASAYVENTADTANNAVIYLASYQENLLTGVSMSAAALEKNETAALETTLTLPQRFDSVKVFVWDSAKQQSICIME